jgi:dolichol-phosphate mannosyltransferase
VDAIAVIPTYNEVENVSLLLPEILALSPGLAVLVVDDHSPDGTGDAVLRLAPRFPGRVFLHARPRKLGLGTAYRDGLTHALGIGRHRALFVMDGDFSHAPSAIPAILSALDAADVAIGSRYVPGGRTSGWGLNRRILSLTANAVARRVLRFSIRDCTSGFIAFRRSAVARLDLARADAYAYGASLELKWLARRAGLRIVEVPIVFKNRERGVSKLGPSLVLDGAATVRRLWSAGRREA